MRIRHAIRNCILMLSCPAAIIAVPAHAQAVHGRVTLPGANDPATGVIVMLMDTANIIVARVLSNANGDFILHANHEARYRLRALRIGYQPTETPFIMLHAGETVERRVEMNATAVVLSGAHVTAERRCTVRPDSGSAAAAAWSEVRKALSTSLLTRQQPYRVELTKFERRMKSGSAEMISETESERSGMSSRPFVSLPIAQLDTGGYVNEDSNGTTYNAPDEEVLLSDQFASTHCLRIGAAADTNEIRLEFEPVKDRTLADIRGTMIVDRSARTLRRLEFSYVNISDAALRANPGGTLTFRPLPAGGWIVDHWMLRMPIMSNVARFRRAQMEDLKNSTLARQRSQNVTAIQESGGDVTSVTLNEKVVWQAPLPTLSGIIVDDSGYPVRNARVTVQTSARSATTDSAGGFTLARITPGSRTVSISTPLFDSLALAPVRRNVDSRESRVPTLTIPTRTALLASACELPPSQMEMSGIVRGKTLDMKGQSVSRANIRATFYQPARGVKFDPGDPGRNVTLSTRSNESGDFLICGVRLDQEISIDALKDERAARLKTRVRALDGITIITLQIADH